MAELKTDWDRWIEIIHRLKECAAPPRPLPPNLKSRSVHARKINQTSCGHKATAMDLNGYPACAIHRTTNIRESWKGKIEGA